MLRSYPELDPFKPTKVTYCSLQRLLDTSLPEDMEDGLGEDSLTYSIGTALDHIGAASKLHHELHLVNMLRGQTITTCAAKERWLKRSLCKGKRG